MFGLKGLQTLVFDETPYKKYMAKVIGTPSIKFIPFDFMEDIRVYKGEGQVQLVAYFPYALSVNPPHLENATYGNLEHNGDLPGFLEITYSAAALSDGLELALQKSQNGILLNKLTLNGFTANAEDTYILINSRTSLIEGLDSNYNKTGNLYNKYITEGDFFNIPVGSSYITSNIEFEKLIYTPLFY